MRGDIYVKCKGSEVRRIQKEGSGARVDNLSYVRRLLYYFTITSLERGGSELGGTMDNGW